MEILLAPCGPRKLSDICPQGPAATPCHLLLEPLSSHQALLRMNSQLKATDSAHCAAWDATHSVPGRTHTRLCGPCAVPRSRGLFQPHNTFRVGKAVPASPGDPGHWVYRAVLLNATCYPHLSTPGPTDTPGVTGLWPCGKRRGKSKSSSQAIPVPIGWAGPGVAPQAEWHWV